MLTTPEGAQQITAILRGLHEELQADFAAWPDRLQAVVEAAGKCGCDECEDAKNA